MWDQPNVELRCPSARSFQKPQKVLVHLDSRTVAMEVGIRSGVCKNSPAEWISPENGWRSSVPTYTRPLEQKETNFFFIFTLSSLEKKSKNKWKSKTLLTKAPTSRRAWGPPKKIIQKPWRRLDPWGWLERTPVQILVEVANIQMRTLKTEVEKGSMWTAVGHGSVGPET